MKVYWYQGEGGLNFGDALNPVLFRRLAGITLEWVPPGQADLFGIGSNVGMIPDNYTGIVFGTGISAPDNRSDLSTARVLAVRGHLTAMCSRIDRVPYADLGLLASELLSHRPKPDIDHGHIRHFADRRKVRGFEIDILGGPDYVVREAARCSRITSSSLHGLILADALGIRNRWSPSAATRMVKFEDYISGYNEALLPYVWRKPNSVKVAEKQAMLLDALRSLA